MNTEHENCSTRETGVVHENEAGTVTFPVAGGTCTISSELFYVIVSRVDGYRSPPRFMSPHVAHVLIDPEFREGMNSAELLKIRQCIWHLLDWDPDAAPDETYMVNSSNAE